VRTDAIVGRLDGQEPSAVNSAKGRRWCLLLAATMAAAVLFSLSASEQAHAQSSAYVCPSGVIVFTLPCPYVPPWNYKTAPLKGTVAAGANHQTVFCPEGSTVSRLVYYADVNVTLGGVQVYCRNGGGPESAVGPVIGHASTNGAPCCLTSSTALACPPVTDGGYASTVWRGYGIFGATLDVIYRLGLRCGRWNTSSFTTTSSGQVGNPYTPNPLTVPGKGPFECPFKTYMVGLTGESAPYSGLAAGGYNVTALWADCHDDYILGDYREVPPPSIGAAAPRTPSAKRYRASSGRGTVKLRLVASHATRGAWYYGIEQLMLPAGCGRVPGGFVANRSKRSQHARFKASRSGFRVKGYVFGALAKPKVHATVTVKKGGCRGEAITFTARPS
jgi:hypothetical protein